MILPTTSSRTSHLSPEPVPQKFASGWENKVFFNPICCSQWLKKHHAHTVTLHMISQIITRWILWTASDTEAVGLRNQNNTVFLERKKTLTMISRVQVPPWPLTGLVLGSLEYKSWNTLVNSPLVWPRPFGILAFVMCAWCDWTLHSMLALPTFLCAFNTT